MKKIIAIFPNIKEIHFINDYKFDNEAFQSFLKQIEKKDNKLKKIKFIYYEYDDNNDIDDNKENESIVTKPFIKPKDLKQSLWDDLSKLDWTWRDSEDSVGYKIRLWKNDKYNNVMEQPNLRKNDKQQPDFYG